MKRIPNNVWYQYEIKGKNHANMNQKNEGVAILISEEKTSSKQEKLPEQSRIL